jgi:hypothetical protein
MLNAATIAFVTVFSTTSSRAELSALDAVNRYKHGDHEVVLFVEGLYNGIAWSNTFIISGRNSALYCQPHSVVLKPKQIFEIVERYITRIPADEHLPLGGVLLYALIDAFPCKK